MTVGDQWGVKFALQGCAHNALLRYYLPIPHAAHVIAMNRQNRRSIAGVVCYSYIR
jgi:hypothetical protein